MPPQTPTHPSPFGSIIPSSSTHSRHSSTSSRSTTPDSVFSDATRLSVTPYKVRHTDPDLAALETPLRPARTKTRKTRQKPTYQPGIMAYPLTFPDPRDVYTYHTDSNYITDLLDREHLRVQALPHAVFEGINSHSYVLDTEAEKRVGWLTKQWAKHIDAGQGKLHAHEAFPVVHQDFYAHHLRLFTTLYTEKLTRQSRTSRDRKPRALPTRPTSGIRLGFTPQEQATYEQIVKWKGGLPLNMGQYEHWLAEWDTAQLAQRAGRTALGGRRTSSTSTAAGTNGTKTTLPGRSGAGAGKRKRSDLTINVPIIEEDPGSARVDPETPIGEDLMTDRRPEKKRRNHQKTQEEGKGDDEANETITTGVASSYFAKQQKHASAPIASVSVSHSAQQLQSSKPVKQTSRLRKTAEPAVSATANIKSATATPTRLGFTVSKRSMTSSCSSMDGMDKPMGSPAVRGFAGRPLVSAGSLDEELLGLDRSLPGDGLMRPSVGQGIGSAGSLDDELMRLVRGTSPVLPAAEERFVTAPSTLVGPVDPQSAIVEAAAVTTTMDAVPDPQFGVDFWEAAQQRKAAIIARRKSGQREETSDDESQEVRGARVVSAGRSAGSRRGFEMEVERDAEDFPKEQIFPSLSFPKDLATSTPKQAARDLTAAGDETTIMLSSPRRPVWDAERTTMGVSSPHRPVWETESYPTEPVAKDKEVPMVPTQDADEPMLPAEPPTESFNDLTGLMDDLTRPARRVSQAAAVRKPGWNVTSSPPADDGASSGFGPSQQIQRMGARAMTMASDLLGQDLRD